MEETMADVTVDGDYVRHNCIFLNKSGIVSNIPAEGQFFFSFRYETVRSYQKYLLSNHKYLANFIENEFLVMIHLYMYF